MIPPTHPGRFPAIVIAWLLLTLGGNSQTTCQLSTCFLARGEQALLEVSVIGDAPQSLPVISPVKNVAIQPRGQQTKMLPGRRFEYVFQYIVASYEVGDYVIPPVEVMAGGAATRSEPLEFKVFNPDELQWSEVELDGAPFRYASSFRTMTMTPFEGETTYTEIKVFVPSFLNVADWGIPDFQRDGLAAWRFQPSDMQSGVNLLGQSYVSVAYPSTITPTRSGKVAIGPAKVRLKIQTSVIDVFQRREYKDVYLEIPKLEYNARPLPENAPEGFDNAIGNFRLNAGTASTDVKEGDPISIELTVTGSGNLDILRAPKLLDPDGWKIYEPTSDQRSDERRQLSGTTVFHQFMRPLELKPLIPPFRLVYFDPKEEAYKTISTEPIPLNMMPSTGPKAGTGGPIPALPVPIERMTDILAILKPAQLTLPTSPTFPWWSGNLLASLIAVGLIAKALWMRHAPRFKKDPFREQRLKALGLLEKNKTTGDVEFLKSTGAYIESWLGDNQSPEILAILAERDAVCFREEIPPSVLDYQRREIILRTLRKAAMACLALALLGMGIAPARASNIASDAIEAYDAAKFDDAIKLWLSAGTYETLSADTLYNIGNACYRSGSPGYAALYYRRALARDPAHGESRQNLRFIERKYGSITVQRPEFQYTLAKLPLSAWKAILWTGVWVCILSLLVFPATRNGAPVRLFAIAVLVIGPLIASVGILGWRYFPNDAEFAPVARQAVIIAEKTVLHSDAARTSPEVIDAPPGSLCEIITQTGRWAYVAFATKTRGWVPMESIEKVQPTEPPAPPKFRKPKADGKTA
jgi:tetratricopeptide (TPR) repeat protein